MNPQLGTTGGSKCRPWYSQKRVICQVTIFQSLRYMVYTRTAYDETNTTLPVIDVADELRLRAVVQPGKNMRYGYHPR